MIKRFNNNINTKLYFKNKKTKDFNGICFSSFSMNSQNAYKAHYIINNSFKENEKLIRDYLTIWNNWKPTKNWFNIDKIIKDNGLVWNFSQGLHKVNTKICILRFIDEAPEIVTAISKVSNQYPSDTLIKILLVEKYGSGHSFAYGYTSTLSLKKDIEPYKKHRSMYGIHNVWNTGVVTPRTILTNEEKQILKK